MRGRGLKRLQKTFPRFTWDRYIEKLICRIIFFEENIRLNFRAILHFFPRDKIKIYNLQASYIAAAAECSMDRVQETFILLLKLTQPESAADFNRLRSATMCAHTRLSWVQTLKNFSKFFAATSLFPRQPRHPTFFAALYPYPSGKWWWLCVLFETREWTSKRVNWGGWPNDDDSLIAVWWGFAMCYCHISPAYDMSYRMAFRLKNCMTKLAPFTTDGNRMGEKSCVCRERQQKLSGKSTHTDAIHSQWNNSRNITTTLSASELSLYFRSSDGRWIQTIFIYSLRKTVMKVVYIKCWKIVQRFV